MVTFAIGWLVLLLVALVLLMELLRGHRRWRDQRRLQRNRISDYRDEIQSLRAGQQAATTTALTIGEPAWQGSRRFRIQRKQRECNGCHSFYLVPDDGKRLAPFVPGQFLTFTLDVPDEPKSVVRCYSLSAAPRPDYYRCTVRRVLPPVADPSVPPGKASNYLHVSASEDDLLEVKAPRGSFQLNTNSESPLVLIAAGVGITPLFCMLNWLADTSSLRPAHLFYGVRNSEDHIFREELEKIAASYRGLSVTTFYSRPLSGDQVGRDFDISGRIRVDHIESGVSFPEAEYYLCGPGDFMQDMKAGLLSWGIPDEKLHFEAFGPSSVKKVTAKRPASKTDSGTTVRFDRSDKTVSWPADCGSLLELAELHGVPIEAGCRSGNCGTCTTAVKSGRFEYIEQPTTDCEGDACFPCICVPAESIVLDA